VGLKPLDASGDLAALVGWESCRYLSSMMDHSRPREIISLSGNYVKWGIFGVALPLLPLAAGVLAGYLNPRRVHESFTGLLGNGELLIIATVISAAVIGDLLFDISGYSGRAGIIAAILCAFALLIVVVSVLAYGLVAVSPVNPYTGNTAAAVISVMLFLLSLLVGATAVWFSAILHRAI
jgi:hypothetical protein